MARQHFLQTFSYPLQGRASTEFNRDGCQAEGVPDKRMCIPFNPKCDPVYDVSDNLYDVRYNVYDDCGKTCAETDNVYDVRDKTNEKGVQTFRESVRTFMEGDFVEFDCSPDSGFQFRH